MLVQLCAVRPEWGLGARPAPPFGEPKQHRRGAAPPPRRDTAAVSGEPLDSRQRPRGARAASPTPAAGGLSHYAGSVTSSINSRHGLLVASQLRKLYKCILSMQNTADMGEKIIAYKQKEMSAVSDKIRAKADRGEELEPGFMAEIDKSDDLAESGIRNLDKLATEERENKAIMAARPMLAFET